MPTIVFRWLLVGVIIAGLSLRAGGESLDFKVVRKITYAERASGTLEADAYLPRGPGPFPGVLLVHGGAWMTGTRRQLAWEGRQLARRGYAALAISYRLAPRHKFPAQLEDCQAALQWMRENAELLKLDAHRIGGYGYSAGGHLVTLLGVMPEDPQAARDSDEPEQAETLQRPDRKDTAPRLQVIVAGGAPCDFRAMPAQNRALSYWLGGTRQQVPHLYRLASPAAFVSADDPPSFFFHGQRDWLVPLRSSQQMERQLQAAGVSTEFFLIEGASHLQAFANIEAAHRAMRFLDEHLKPPGRQSGAQ